MAHRATPGDSGGRLAGGTPLTPSHLRALRARALAALWLERLAVALLPLLCLAGLFLCAAAIGLFRQPPVLHALLLTLFLATAVALADRARHIFTRPTAAEADRRIEQDSGLRHRPLAALRDRPAAPHDDAAALWDAHRARILRTLDRFRVAAPRPGLEQADPYALRAAALVLAVAVLGTGHTLMPRLADALRLDPAAAPSRTLPLLQVWAQPPAYTGQPPIFLHPAEPTITLPADSRLTISLSGAPAPPRLRLPGPAAKLERLGPGSFRARAILSEAGTLAIAGGGLPQEARWTLTLLPNAPPTVAWNGAPSSDPKTLATRLPWHVAQRWGVASLTAALRPEGHPDLPPLQLRLPLPGTPSDATGALTRDLQAEPYASLPLTATLTATDVSGQTATSAPARFTLAARHFRTPAATAIAAIRTRLALQTETRDAAADDLDAIAASLKADTGTFLNLAAAGALLREPHAALDDAQSRLWTLALALDGALPDHSATVLARARDALRQALHDHAQGKITDAELARRVETLRQALAQRLADLTRRAARLGTLPPDAAGKRLSAPALEKKLQQLENAARDGRPDEAQQRLAELERMLDQLNTARVLSPEEAQRRRDAARQSRLLGSAIQDMIHREAGLMDHAEHRGPPPPPDTPEALLRLREHLLERGMAPAAPEETPPQIAERGQDLRTQQALRQALDAARAGIRSQGGKVPAQFGEAGQAMDQAGTALAEGHEPAARDAQARAIAALQKGGEQLARQQSGQGGETTLELGQDQGSEDGQSDDPGAAPDHANRDPFGRAVEGHGTDNPADPSLHVPDAREEGRARAIQEELRRRGADRARPQEELDYIDRLLRND